MISFNTTLKKCQKSIKLSIKHSTIPNTNHLTKIRITIREHQFSHFSTILPELSQTILTNFTHPQQN